MKSKDVLILAGAAVAVFVLLRSINSGATTPQYWATAQGNTGFPDAARTSAGGDVWI